MASPEVLDLEALVAPVSDDSPVGTDPRSDPSPRSLYYATKDARNTARNAERQAMLGDENAADPDWRPVLKNGEQALVKVGKDLEIAAYLIEALAREHGFAGLRDGFRLVRGLVERYWDGLFPLPDEEGVLTRVAPVTGLNGEDAEGTLIAPINRIPLTEGDSPGPYAYHHYQQAGQIAQIVDDEARQRRIDKGGVSLEMFERAVADTPGQFFVNLVEDIEAAQQAFAEMNQALDEKCGADAPPASNIRSALETCLDTVRNVARNKLAVAAPRQEEAAPEEEAAEEAGSNGASGHAAGRGGVGVGDVIRTREDAFRTLLKVAEYFRNAEPHTPVSYALEQAVRWGRMSLPELLAELISDESTRIDFFRKVGIRPPENQ